MNRLAAGCTCLLAVCPSTWASSSRQKATVALRWASTQRAMPPRFAGRTGQGARPAFGLGTKPRTDARAPSPHQGRDARPPRYDASRPPAASSRRLARDLQPSPPPSRRPAAPPPPDTASKPSRHGSTAPLAILPQQAKSSTPLQRFAFSEYSMNPALKEAVSHFFGGKDPLPTPIQALSLQHFVGSAKQPLNKRPGHDDQRYQVLLGAETGSGKTLAYLLPLFHNLKRTDSGVPSEEEVDACLPRSIVLAPTHELARQLTLTAKQLAHHAKLRVRGLSSTATGSAEDGVVDVLVGTGRSLARAVERGHVKPDRLEWVVVDEADVLLGPDFREETAPLLQNFQAERPPSTILSTATVPPSLVESISGEGRNFHRLLSPALHRLPTKLKTRFVPWSNSGNKLADVVHEVRRVLAQDAMDRAQLLEVNPDDPAAAAKAKVLVFCNSPGRAKMLEDSMAKKAVPCVAWIGDASERVRGSNGALDQFLLKPGQGETVPTAKGTQPRVLITTSLLSRGLDFAPAVKHVFLLDEPRDMLDFLHRAGRTGRAGRIGSVTVFGDAARDRFSKMLKANKR